MHSILLMHSVLFFMMAQKVWRNTNLSIWNLCEVIAASCLVVSPPCPSSWLICRIKSLNSHIFLCCLFCSAVLNLCGILFNLLNVRNIQVAQKSSFDPEMFYHHNFIHDHTFLMNIFIWTERITTVYAQDTPMLQQVIPPGYSKS